MPLQPPVETQTKELIALAIGVAKHCDGCIAFHTRAALQAGAPPEEIMETLMVTVAMDGGPALMYTTHVMEAIEEFTEDQAPQSTHLKLRWFQGAMVLQAH